MLYSIQELAKTEKDFLQKQNYENIYLAIILASDDIASKKYIQNKQKLLEELNIEYRIFSMINCTQKELNDLIDCLSKDEKVTGIMLELPLNKNLDSFEAIEHINFKKDVDGITNYNLGKLQKTNEGIIPCTVLAVSKILDSYFKELSGKNITIIGRSILLGKPLANYLTNKNATCTLCHSKTKDLKQYTLNADIVVVAVGKKHFLTREFLKESCFVVDVGTNYIDGKLYGDVDFENVSNSTNYVTSVPNGVGVLTKLCMIENLLKLKNK